MSSANLQFSASKLNLQGNRVNGLRGDEACKEVVVPGGNLAAEAEGILARRLSDQVVGRKGSE